MLTDLAQYFALLAQYLSSKWTRVIVGVLVGMVAQACALISPLLTLKLHTTIMVIAHRMSTVRVADRIAVLGNGRIEGIGTHESLLENNQTYQRIFSSSIS